MEEEKIKKSLILVNHKNLSITDYFINILDNKFKNELVDIKGVEALEIENIKFNISKQLKEYFYLFIDDFIIFNYPDYNINCIITIDNKKYNNGIYEITENGKFINIDDNFINIYYTPVFNYSFYCKIKKDSDFIFYNNNVYFYPLTFYKLFKVKPDLKTIGKLKDKSFNQLINKIIKDENINKSALEPSIDNEELKQYFFISLYLNKDKIYKDILSKTDKDKLKNLLSSLIFYIIKIKNLNILLYLQKTKNDILKDILFNTLNFKGLTVLEYSFLKFKKDNSYYKIVSFLNDYNYQRPNYIFDIILNTNIIHHNIINDYDQLLLSRIKKLKGFENIEIINSIILKTLYDNLNSENNIITVQDIIKFINYNINYINLSVLFNLIFKYSSILVLKELLINKILSFNADILKLLINLKQTDYLLKEYKEESKKQAPMIIYDLIDNLNIYGLIFLIKYIDNSLINLKDDKNNNIMHYLCNQNIMKYKEDYEDLQYDVFKFFIQEKESLILEVNDKHETPIFNTIIQNNLYLFKLNIGINPECCNIKNFNGSYIIHEIIKANFKQALLEYIINDLNIDFLDIYNNNALLLAIKNKNQELANELIKAKANINIIDINGNSIYHYIALYNLKNIDISVFKNIENIHNLNIMDCVKNNIYWQYKKYIN